MDNPVFVNEMRQSVFRRKPVLGFALWALATAFLIWLSQFAGLARYPLSWLPAFALPLIVPPFAAATFAKEYEQHTWQDLYLTRLTNAQVIVGKFSAALLQVGLIVLSFLPAILFLVIREGNWETVEPGWWMFVLGAKLMLSASLYVLLGMTCSRYSSNRRTALVWSYVALFLYAAMGAMIWSLVGEDVAQSDAYAYAQSYYGSTQAPPGDPIAPGFMQGLHLMFCAVVGIGTFVLLWVSLSEQRGYREDGRADSNRAWQPLGKIRRG